MAKSYTMWLRSGESVYGDVTPKQEKVMRDYYLKQNDEIAVIKDTDGELMVNPKDIIALGLNKKPPLENKKIGFR